ncbi:MAG: type II toxin-antitoxin system HicA family toxin [Dehalococcoidia bacterium]|nr:MAG: type II toxin-antitoxin system HicA family toxin [Dehalococcoidia bacterium]
MSRLPLCSSAEIVRALQRAGFRKAHSSGSHQTMEKQIGGRTITTVVPLGKREVPRGTLRGILRLAEMSQVEFRKHLRS